MSTPKYKLGEAPRPSRRARYAGLNSAPCPTCGRLGEYKSCGAGQCRRLFTAPRNASMSAERLDPVEGSWREREEMRATEPFDK